MQTAVQISIHALRMEGDVVKDGRKVDEVVFLSTPSGWRATSCKSFATKWASNFYPRPPGGGRQREHVAIDGYFKFLSTPSGWRATRVILYGWRCWIISIHALRVEGDECRFLRSARYADFYPRPPGGGRHKMVEELEKMQDFYPRPPGGGRQFCKVNCALMFDFYPRPPGGGRRMGVLQPPRRGGFLSTPSGWRATGEYGGYRKNTRIFLSTPSGWRATGCSMCGFGIQLEFLSTPSGWRATYAPSHFAGRSGFLSTPSGWRATAAKKWWGET